MARVNLWELITECAGKDGPNADKCRAVLAEAGQKGGFGSELSLQICSGVWTTTVFHHESLDQKVNLIIGPTGHLSVKRSRTQHDMYEEREVQF